jgi:hypothetical protein
VGISPIGSDEAIVLRILDAAYIGDLASLIGTNA